MISNASEQGDMQAQRNYWFQVANNHIDFVDWICENKLAGYDTSDLLKEFEQYQESLTGKQLEGR